MVSDNGDGGDKREQPQHLGAFGYVAAILLCCLITSILAYNFGRQNERRLQAPASYAIAAKADVQRTCVGDNGSIAFDCVYEKVEAAQEQARGEQDLSAQQKAANGALLSAIVAFFTLILSGVGVWYVRGTLRATLEAVEDTGRATDAMLEANTIAREIGRAQTTSYLGAKDVKFHVSENGLIPHIAFKILNAGASPAIDPEVKISIIMNPINKSKRPMFAWEPELQANPFRAIGAASEVEIENIAIDLSDEMHKMLKVNIGKNIVHVALKIDLIWKDVFGDIGNSHERFVTVIGKQHDFDSVINMKTAGSTQIMLHSELTRRKAS